MTKENGKSGCLTCRRSLLADQTWLNEKAGKEAVGLLVIQTFKLLGAFREGEMIQVGKLRNHFWWRFRNRF